MEQEIKLETFTDYEGFEETNWSDFYLSYEKVPGNVKTFYYSNTPPEKTTIYHLNDQINEKEFKFLNFDQIYGYIFNDVRYINKNYKPRNKKDKIVIEFYYREFYTPFNKEITNE